MITVPKLTDNIIHVWQASLLQAEAALQEYWNILEKSEQERALRFVKRQHQNSFICARGMLRFLLASYFECNPKEISFGQNPYGKLYVSKPNNNLGLCFNLSHANDLAMYVFALNKQVGIDVEFVKRDVAVDDIVRRFFALQEQKDFFSLPDAKQPRAFFDCWTRKEAFIKAIGKGMSHSLDTFSVDLSLAKEVTRLNLVINSDSLINANAQITSAWSLFNLKVDAENYCSALAVEGECATSQILQLRCF